MNLRQRLDEIRQLEQKATPMPWAAWRHFVDRQLTVPHTVSPLTQVLARCDCDQNAALIAAMRNAIGPLLEVVEQQHRALEEVTRFADELAQADNSGVTPFGFQIIRDARAALSLMDKEDSNG